jgi:hypothetical protein
MQLGPRILRRKLPRHLKQPEGKTAFSREVPPLLLEYCVTCHGGAKPRGQLPLDQLAQKPDFAKNIVAWEKVLTVLRGGDMPPPGRKRPEPAVFQRAAAAIDAELERTYARLPRDPGRVTIRRLNRVEYRNTIRDLMGVDYPATEELPSDDVGLRFRQHCRRTFSSTGASGEIPGGCGKNRF